MKWSLIANDNINDSINIDNVNYDYTTQALVIGLQKVVGIEVNEKPLNIFTLLPTTFIA